MYQHVSIPMQTRTRRFRYLALFSYLALLLWIAYWQMFLVEQTYSLPFIVLMYIAPLLFPAVGIIRAKAYTHAWASFIVLYYLMHSITVLYSEPDQRLYASIELVLAVALFVGCCVFARLRGKECGLGLGKLKDEMAKEKAYFEES